MAGWLHVDRQSSIYLDLLHTIPPTGPLAITGHLATVFISLGVVVSVLSVQSSRCQVYRCPGVQVSWCPGVLSVSWLCRDVLVRVCAEFPGLLRRVCGQRLFPLSGQYVTLL